MNTVNERVRNIRRRAKYNQTELGKLLGLKTSTYSQKERCGHFTGEDLIKLAEIFDVDVREFLYDNIPETEPTIIVPEDCWHLDDWEEEIIKIYRYVTREQKKKFMPMLLRHFIKKDTVEKENKSTQLLLGANLLFFLYSLLFNFISTNGAN